MNSPIELAQYYLDENTELREQLQVPRFAILNAVPLGQGEHNANFQFLHPSTGSVYVLRVNYASQMGLTDQIGYEAHALRLLASSGRVPQVFYVDSTLNTIDHGLLVMEFCSGRHLNFLRQDDIAEAARTLADIHAVSPTTDRMIVRPIDPLREQLEECQRLFAGYRGTSFEDAQVVTYVERFFERVERALGFSGKADDANHVLNTEAVSDHFLINEDGSSGHMVDWEKPIIGEVAQDVAYFLAPTTIWNTDFIFAPAERTAFIRTYWDAVDGRFLYGNFDERYEAYLMSNCLRGITWSCNAWVEYHDPNRPLKNAKTFEKLKFYLSKDFLSRLQREIFVG